MASANSLSFCPLQFPSQFYANFTKPFIILPKMPLKSRKITLPTVLWCTAPKHSAPQATEQEILEAVAESDGSERTLPAVRAYENDLARLSLVGTVDFQQALTAAAADGGVAAQEHISAGMPAMVVETVFPGSSDDHSTISTRLGVVGEKIKRRRNIVNEAA